MAKKASVPWWIEFSLKHWQPLVALLAGVVGLVVFLWTLNPRLSAQEKKLELHDSAIVELKKSNEIWQDIYTSQQAQQAAPRPWTFLREEGDWQVFLDPEGITRCCDGTDCVPLTKKGKCPR